MALRDVGVEEDAPSVLAMVLDLTPSSWVSHPDRLQNHLNAILLFANAFCALSQFNKLLLYAVHPSAVERVWPIDASLAAGNLSLADAVQARMHSHQLTGLAPKATAMIDGSLTSFVNGEIRSLLALQAGALCDRVQQQTSYRPQRRALRFVGFRVFLISAPLLPILQSLQR